MPLPSGNVVKVPAKRRPSVSVFQSRTPPPPPPPKSLKKKLTMDTYKEETTEIEKAVASINDAVEVALLAYEYSTVTIF